jgi:hypothetical protein
MTSAAWARRVADDDRVYRRALPGGGYVAIDSSPDATGDSGVKAQVLVERRSDPGRRVGHAPPVVAETEAADVEEALDALSDLADNNVEVARALQRWQARRSGEAAAAAEQADGGRTEPKSESGPGKNPV